MTDIEKKIAEIREGLTFIVGEQSAGKWMGRCRFLLSVEENRKLREERDEARSKAEEAWKEIDSLEEQLLSSQQEIEWLRQLYEREREIADQALEQVKNLREERNQDRQWIEKASENVTQLQQERDKMIEWLRMCLFNHGCWREEDYVAYMRDILKEIGVTVK
jgi:hypothetical protein